MKKNPSFVSRNDQCIWTICNRNQSTVWNSPNNNDDGKKKILKMSLDFNLINFHHPINWSGLMLLLLLIESIRIFWNFLWYSFFAYCDFDFFFSFYSSENISTTNVCIFPSAIIMFLCLCVWECVSMIILNTCNASIIP